MKVIVRVSLVIALVVVLYLPGLSRAEVWTTPEPVSELNSGSRDLSAFLTADGKTLLMASDRPYSDKNQIEMYISHLVDGIWTTPSVLPNPPNMSGAWDDMPSLTLDGRYMYFMSNRSGGMGSGDIYVSENINGLWQDPVNLGSAVNSASDENCPNISTDGQSLIFSSNRSGGYGAYDLYQAQKVDGQWQPAVNMGSTINGIYNNDHPTLSYTGHWLFQSAHSEIVRSENVNGVWQTPVNVGPPVNTSGDDVVTFFLDCTDSIWMAAPGSGGWDIKTATWLDAPGPNPCSSLVIPKGEWRVRVTLLEASAVLKNDIYIDEPVSQLLIRNSLKNVGSVVTTPFISADELVFHIHVNGGAMGLGQYDHYSNSEFARVERTDPLRYIIGFEDLPADQADWDFNDTVLLVELIGKEVNIREDTNYLGEAQMVEQADSGADTELTVDMNYGLGLAADVVVPGAGLTEPTYGILVEGDPALYTDILADAPFEPTGDFLKVELTSGQDQMVSGNDMQIALELNSQLEPQDAADALAPRLYRFDEDSSTWVEVANQSMPASDQVVATTPDVGLYALGIPTAAPPADGDGGDTGEGNDTDGKSVVPVVSGAGTSGHTQTLSCGELTGSVPDGAGIAALLMLCPLFIAAMVRIIKRS